MYRLISLCCLLGAVFGRQPAAPQHRADLLPDTEFSCRDKVLGGYYADPDAQCQMFHVCVKVAGVGIQDFRFLCPNGTAFDQEAQICAGWPDVACEPAALYYSSDNFDLYRIGSGFESKKAPAAFEDEPDFHLQRAEPDILSGAHSSNFFNNREGKDNQDIQESGGQTKNQVDQPQRKKIVRKLQRRPTESAPKAASTTSRQITNNFAGSYGPTTSRNSGSTTLRTSSQAPQNNENYNNYNSQKTNSNYQSYRQPSSTSAPSYDQSKYSKPVDASVKTEQTTAQNKNNRSFKSRQQSTPDYKYTDNNQQYKSSQQSSTVDYNNYNNGGSQQFDKKQPTDYNNYNNENYNSNQDSVPKFNKERKQPTYQNQQSTAKINYGSEASVQYNGEKTSPQYNTNNANKNTQQYNQQSTPKYNFNAENDQKYNNNQDYASKITAKTTQQSTPQYNQQYNNQQSSQSTYNGENIQAFDKIKSSAKYAEKKQQFNNNKPSAPEYNNYNADNGQSSQQQTPAPKYNTNLQYDNNNNQQSTPNYYSADYNQQLKTSQSPSSTYQQQQQYSTASPSAPDYSGNQQYQQKSSTEYQQYSTPRPAVSSSAVNYNNNNQQKSTVNQQYQQKSSTEYQQYSTPRPAASSSVVNYNNNNQQKSSANQQYSTSRQPANNQQFQQKATSAPFKSNKPDDYDDGQYRPELYEREAGGEYDVTVRQSSRKEAQFEVTQEPELLKAAHSINIAASKNQLARENRHQIPLAPSSTAVPVIQTPKPTTQAPPRLIVTTPAPARSVYANFAAVTSSAPRPFSLRPDQSSAAPSVPKQTPAKVQSKAAPPANTKPASSKKGKDVSYDYAYYDNSDHYSEYENIEEFGRTSKKQ